MASLGLLSRLRGVAPTCSGVAASCAARGTCAPLAAAPTRGAHALPYARSLDATSLKGRHFEDLFSLTAAEIDVLLRIAHSLKLHMGKRGWVYQPLIGKSMSMIFQKRSTRTRVSTEAGFAQLGGHALFLGSEDIQLGKNESLRDTAEVLSRLNDVLLARVFGHADIVELAAHASVPVINALSDKHHPLQGLADVMTLDEHFGSFAGRTLAWVGDGNNIAHTLLSAAGKRGFHMRVATPAGFEPDAGIVAAARADAARAGVTITLTADPAEAVHGADAIVTDTWVSMGQEAEAAERVRRFAGYQVTEAMAAGAAPGWVFLHCLPRKPYEVDDAVFYSRQRSLVFEAAGNRKWTVMAVVLAQLLGGADLPPA